MLNRGSFDGDVIFKAPIREKMRYLRTIEKKYSQYNFSEDIDGYIDGYDVLVMQLDGGNDEEDPKEILKELCEDTRKHGITMNGRITYVDEEEVPADEPGHPPMTFRLFGEYYIKDNVFRDQQDNDMPSQCSEDGDENYAPMPEQRTYTGERGTIVKECAEMILSAISEFNGPAGESRADILSHHTALVNELEGLVDGAIEEYQDNEEDTVKLSQSTIDGLVIPDILESVDSTAKRHYKSYIPLKGKAMDELGDQLSAVFRKAKEE